MLHQAPLLQATMGKDKVANDKLRVWTFHQELNSNTAEANQQNTL
jgi:hypothetical protein